MADAPVLAPPSPPDAPSDDRGGNQVRPRRSLPGGRAVVGAFLVVVAAVGTFGAYLTATAAPTTSYVVAVDELRVGEVLSAEDLAGRFQLRAMELPEEQAARAVPAADAERLLLGTVVVAPVAPGDLLTRSAVADVTTAAQGVQLSFSIPADRAVAGTVSSGERIDIIATFRGVNGDGETRVVARQVVVVANPTAAVADGLDGGRITITVQVPDLVTAQLLQHAVDVAEIAILRGAASDAANPTPATTASQPQPAPAPAQPAQPAQPAEPDADAGTETQP